MNIIPLFIVCSDETSDNLLFHLSKEAFVISLANYDMIIITLHSNAFSFISSIKLFFTTSW